MSYMPRNKRRIKFGRQRAPFATFMVLIIEFYAFPRLFCLSSGLYTKQFQGHMKNILLFQIIVEMDSIDSSVTHPNVLKPLKNNL